MGSGTGRPGPLDTEEFLLPARQTVQKPLICVYFDAVIWIRMR